MSRKNPNPPPQDPHFVMSDNEVLSDMIGAERGCFQIGNTLACRSRARMMRNNKRINGVEYVRQWGIVCVNNATAYPLSRT